MMPLMIAGIAGGTALSVYSTLQGGKEAAEEGKLQQQQYEAEAQAELMAGGEQARIKRREGRRLTASQIATFSASGSGLVGSNLVVMAETARNVEMDALTIERNASVKAGSLRQQGALARYEGQLARRNARMRAFADIAMAVGTAALMYGAFAPAASAPPGSMGAALSKGGIGIHVP